MPQNSMSFFIREQRDLLLENIQTQPQRAFIFADNVMRHYFILNINFYLIVVGQVLMIRLRERLNNYLMQMADVLKLFVQIVKDILGMCLKVKG
jgi:hypothetical protein